MMVFWILAGGLAVLALAFVLVPLLSADPGTPDPDSNALNLGVFRQQLAELDGDLALGKLDQAQYEAARHDLERELIHDLEPVAQTGHHGPSGRWAAPILALGVPAAAVALYLNIGTQGIIPRLEAAALAPTATQTQAGQAPTAPDGSPMPSLDVLAQQLADRLEQAPNNPTGWVMLARTWTHLGQPDKALAALERGYQVVPSDPEILLAYAEALAEAKGQDLTGRPTELIDQVLAAQPDNPNGLWLRGLAAFQSKDFQGALTRWEALQAQLDPSSEDATELGRIMDEARAQAGLAAQVAATAPAPAAPVQAAPAQSTAAQPTPAQAAPTAPPQTAATPPPPSPTATPAAQTQPATAGLTVSVALDPALAAQVPPNATVFIYAKAVAGPPMPLAAQRVRVADLPLTLTLDDSMAMMPQMRLSAFPQVTVGARISRSGQPMAQSGDLEGEVSPVASSRAEPVAVTIATVRP